MKVTNKVRASVCAMAWTIVNKVDKKKEMYR